MSDLLLELIRRVVVECEERHGYMPTSAEEAREFKPHQWVRDVCDQWATQAYAEGRKDQSEADHLSNAAAVLIDAWVAQHGRQISWEKAVEITAIVTKLPDAERQRLLALNESA